MENVRRTLNGVVVSDKMQKTVVVRVDRMVSHPRYHKKYTVSKRLKADTADMEVKEGDRVEIIDASRKLSKSKRWTVTKILS